MKPLKKPSYMIKEPGRIHPLWAQLILIVAAFCLSVFAQSVVLLIIYSLVPGTEGRFGAHDLFSTVGSIIAILLFARLFEKRPRASLLLRLAKNTSVVTEYLLGLLSGAILFCLVMLLLVLTDTVRLAPAAVNAPAGTLVLFFCAFLVQGFSEELLCRGYYLGSLMPTVSLPMAVLLSSLAFAAIHIFNYGLTFLAFVNMVLYGVFSALFALRRGSIWAVAGMHTAWNYVQGILFGNAVSGTRLGASVLEASVSKSSILLNGGAFGPEGGLGVTLVLALGIVFTLFFMEQKEK